MKSLTILVMFLTSLIGQAMAASELFYGENKVTNRTESVAIECVEGVLGKCSSYKFQIANKKSGEVLTTTEAMNEEAALAKLGQALAAFDTRFHVEALVAGTGITFAACIVGYIEPHANVLKVACPLIPVGVAVDVVKAPIVLPLAFAGYTERKIKFSLLQKRIKKILRGEKAKATKLDRREYEDLSVHF